MADVGSPKLQGHGGASVARRVFGPFVVALVIAGAIALLLVLVEIHKAVTVRNDTKSWVRIASCVDDADDVNAGASFRAEGVPEHGLLFCLVTPEATGTSRCVAVPQRTGPVALTALRVVAASRCH
jgi:hypothetical protein